MHATITYLYCVSIKYFVEWMRKGKCLCKRLEKVLQLLFLIFIEYGGLNQIILRLLFSLTYRSEDVSETKAGFSHFFKVSLHVLAVVKDFLVWMTIWNFFWLTDFGICFLMLGGWLEFILMYVGLSLGFL